MKIYGKEITDECGHCGEVLQCELFLRGHGIKKERTNTAEMIRCQIEHSRKRTENSSSAVIENKKDIPEEIKAIYNAVWKIYKGMPNPQSDEEWLQIDRECKILLKMYDCQFARDLVQAMIAEMEHRMKNS